MVKVRNWGEEGNSSSSSVELYSGPSLSSIGRGSRQCSQLTSANNVEQGSFSEVFDSISTAAWALRAKLVETGGIRRGGPKRVLKEMNSSKF